jgi:uncharacterized protein
MKTSYRNLSSIEHYIFKSYDDFIFLDVKTLDVYILNEIEKDIIEIASKSFNNNHWNILIKNYEESIIIQSLESLLKNGLLKKKNIKEGNLVCDLNPKEPIKNMTLLISEDCNLACKYCYVKNGYYTGKSALMNSDIGKKSIDFLIMNSMDQADLFISFFGGEPLINFKIIKRLVSYALEEGKKHSKHFHFSLTTNGVLLNDESLEFINKHKISVVISIDGDSYSHNLNRPLSGGGKSYHILVNNLKKLKKLNVWYSARVTVSSLTISRIAHNFEHLLSFGFRRIHLENALAPAGNIFITDQKEVEEIKKQYSNITKRIKQIIISDQLRNVEIFPFPLKAIIEKNKILYPCGAGRGTISVDVDGNIYLCHRLVGEHKFLLGNVNNQTYNQKLGDTIKKEMNADNKVLCKKCWARYICGGGCYAINHEFNKNISLTPQSYCQLKKESIKQALVLYQELYKECQISSS